MDIGLAFEDEDLQGTEKNREGDRHLPYNVKICSNQWFEDAVLCLPKVENPKDISDIEHVLKVMKFSADFHYFQKDYQVASRKYKEISDTISLSSKNNCSQLWQDVQESLCRCCIYTGQTQQGLQIARDMVKAALTEDETKQRQTLALLSFACEKTNNWAECVNALEKLCELQPYFPQVWQKLGDVYNYMDHESLADKHILYIKQLSSYVRAKLLFKSVMGTVNEFIKDRNVSLIQELTLKIDQVPMSSSKKQFATEFILKDIESSATTTSNKESRKEKVDKSSNGSFYERFCIWNSSCEI